MAKIVITIEDSPNGKVKVVSNPTAETMIKKVASGNELTSAEGYAFSALNHIVRESKKQTPSIIIPIPRIGRR